MDSNERKFFLHFAGEIQDKNVWQEFKCCRKHRKVSHFSFIAQQRLSFNRFYIDS